MTGPIDSLLAAQRREREALDARHRSELSALASRQGSQADTGTEALRWERERGELQDRQRRECNRLLAQQRDARDQLRPRAA